MDNTITSNDLIDCDECFKIAAGPGAGKTHWLCNHIKNVISNSKRLGIKRKIACITYTNVGANTIRSRVCRSSDRLEVATIHSFLYTHIVKPYIHFIAKDFGLNHSKLKLTGDDFFIGNQLAQAVKERTGYVYVSNKRITEAISQARWQFKEDSIDFKPKFPIKANDKYYLPNYIYNTYKYILWEKGVITYDDIMYFSYQLLTKIPNIKFLIKSAYPYFFVDEFQDSTPIQIAIFKILGNSGIIIGVIGDRCQSIYDFIGASIQQFDNFHLEGMNRYVIKGNRRSSNQIIDLLNCVRKDLTQDKILNIDDTIPMLLVGDKFDCYNYCKKKLLNNSDIHTLSYPNHIANSFKAQKEDTPSENLLKSDFDSNLIRKIIIKSLIQGIEFTRDGNYGEAYHCLKLIEEDSKKNSYMLKKLIEAYPLYSNDNLISFLRFVKTELNIQIASPNKNNLKFYKEHYYWDLACYVSISDNTVNNKTVHKAKGDEFENVLLVLEKEEDISFLLKPDLEHKNHHRVFYVGISRAEKKLFISVPNITEQQEMDLSKLPIIIKKVTSKDLLEDIND